MEEDEFRLLIRRRSMSSDTTSKPIATKQFDRVQAAIWRRDNDANDANRPLHTLTLSRSFKDAQGEWRRSHSFTARDLPHVQLAVEWALRELLLKDD
jgi:hypothetical protein